MRLKSSLQISAVFPIILAIVVSLGVLIRSRLIQSARLRLGVAEEAVDYGMRLKTLAYNAIISGDQGLRSEWERVSMAFKEFLAEVRPHGLMEDISRDSIEDYRAKMQEAFLELFAVRRHNGLTVKTGAEKDSVTLLKEAMDEASSQMVAEAFRFARSAEKSAADFEDNTDRLFVVFLAVLSMIMASTVLATSRSTIKRLESLKEVADKVAEGDLSQRLDGRGGDEVSDAFRSLNTMLMKMSRGDIVSGSTAADTSGDDARRVKDAAREGSMRLADALTKLKRAQKQIVQQERIHALEQIGNGVTRDFAKALTPILSTSDFLLSYPEHRAMAEELEEGLKTINDAAKDARKKVRDLMEVFQPGRHVVGRCMDLNKAVQRAVELTEPRWKAGEAEGKSVSCEVAAGDIPLVEGAEADFVEAILHLIVNAVEAMPDGGTIHLSTRSQRDQVMLKVRDNGDGMSSEVQARCLEPFFSTKGAGNSGMGLTTVLATVGRYGGKLDIETGSGKGTTITITLPTSSPGSKTVEEDKDVRVGRVLDVLLVDDEKWTRNVVGKILTAEGHRVSAVENGKKAIAALESGSFDAMVLDLALPDISGEDVALHCSEQHPKLPIVMLSGYGAAMRERGDMPKGVDAVLGKPTTVNELLGAIMEAIARKG